jgi:hypothetical protein
MTSFAFLAATEAPAHDDLAFGLAAELGCPAGAAPARLGELAAAMPRGADPHAELEALRAVAAELRPSPGGALLLPLVLAGGGGHPAAIAVAVAAVAARAGIRAEPIGAPDGRLFVAHVADLDPPLVIDPAAPERLIDGRSLAVDLSWRCAHETALSLLDEIVARAMRPNDLSTALAASALRLALPLDGPGRDRVAEAHAKLLARLN